jgi:Zn-dependent protease with chaperone function
MRVQSVCANDNLTEIPMTKTASAFRTTREKIYQAMMIGIGCVLWIVIGLTVGVNWHNGTLRGYFVHMLVNYGVSFAAIYWAAGAAYRASAFGNMILLGPKQFPHLYAILVECSREIGLRTPPTTFVYNSNGLFNAFARRLCGRRFVFLTSALIDATSDAQVRFVIGHELGHHAAGHLNPWWNALKLPAHLVPFLDRAYSRSREYTCDRIGAYLAKDAMVPRTALQMLGCGCRRLNESMNCEAFIEQERLVPPIFGFITEIHRSHPRLTRRVAAIDAEARWGRGEEVNMVEPVFSSSASPN